MCIYEIWKAGDKKNSTGNRFYKVTVINSPVGGTRSFGKIFESGTAFFLLLLSRARDEYC